MDDTKLGEGFVAGAGLLLVELAVFALLLAGEAVTPGLYDTLKILVLLASCLLSAKVGYGFSQSWEFIAGFFFGGFFALWLAGEISGSMGAAAAAGVITGIIIGVVAGLLYKALKR
jgi:hypothetical protein